MSSESKSCACVKNKTCDQHHTQVHPAVITSHRPRRLFNLVPQPLLQDIHLRDYYSIHYQQTTLA